MHSFTRFVKARLIESGTSITEVARRSGEDPRTVSHILRGKRTNRAAVVLQEIALATGLKYGDLLEMYGMDRRAKTYQTLSREVA